MNGTFRERERPKKFALRGPFVLGGQATGPKADMLHPPDPSSAVVIRPASRTHMPDPTSRRADHEASALLARATEMSTGVGTEATTPVRFAVLQGTHATAGAGKVSGLEDLRRGDHRLDLGALPGQARPPQARIHLVPVVRDSPSNEEHDALLCAGDTVLAA